MRRRPQTQPPPWWLPRIPRWILCLAGLLAALAMLAMTGCARTAAASQTMMLYTAFPGDSADRLVAAFERKTGIHVDKIKEGTSRVYSRLRAEKSYPRADVWLGGGGMVPFIGAAESGLLEPYTPPALADLPVKRGNLILRDAQWRWIGSTVIGLGYAYNPQFTKPEELPQSWEDLADPKWKGQIIMWDPAESGTAMLFLEAALLKSRQTTGNEEAGWRFLKAFYGNMLRYAEEGPPSLMVSRNEVKIGIHFEHQMLLFLEQSNDPAAIAEAQKNLRWTLPPSSPVIVDPIALMHGGPHPELGKKFIDFVLSHEGQAVLNHSYFFTLDPSFGPPQYLEGWTRDDLLAHAMPLDVEWMGANYNRILTHWQNDIERSDWIWEAHIR
jgi:iron(III) transport system substrate-binding protein